MGTFKYIENILNTFTISFVFSFLVYLLLTAGSGNLLLWSYEEILFGIIFSVVSALIVRKLFYAVGAKLSFHFLNPKRWFLFLVYIFGPFLIGMIKANFDVAYRVITGKIKPGIVKIPSGLKTDFGVMMLANSITLTPGTLSVDVDEKNNLYIHWINVKSKNPKPEEVCFNFPKWVRWITE